MDGTTPDDVALLDTLEKAAARAWSRLPASEQALQRVARMRDAGTLGAGMSLPPRSGRQALPPVAQIDPEIAADPARTWAAIDKAKLRRQSLAAQGDPLAGKTPEPDSRVGAPSSHRRHGLETAIETYTTTVKAGRDMASEAWRVVPVAEAMRRRGQLGEREERAAQRFYRDFILGHASSGLVSSYGQSPGGGRSPDFEVRGRFQAAFVAACRAIDHWPTTEWMVRIICEQLLAAETRTPTLTDAGREFMRYKQAQQAQAAGATMIKIGLQRLVAHYGVV